MPGSIRLVPEWCHAAERASVPSSSGIPTHKRRDIPLDAANSAGRGTLRLVLILVASFMVVLITAAVALAVFGASGDRAAMLAATVVALAATAVSWHAARRARARALAGADAAAAVRSA